MSVTGWISMSRVVRGEFLKIKNLEFVQASKTLEASNLRLIFKHILPNTLGAIIVTSMFTVPSAIFLKPFKFYWNWCTCTSNIIRFISE